MNTLDKKIVSLKGKHILDLASLSLEEINLIFIYAEKMKKYLQKEDKKNSFLKGKSIVTLFYESSTRTRTSFELAGKYLGSDVVNINAQASSITKGESLKDTLLTLEDMDVDLIILRHEAEGAPFYASRILNSIIINAGDGSHAHPTQGLLDVFTIRECKGTNPNLKITIIGDILHSRVARSNISIMKKMGYEIHLAGPDTLIPRYFKEDKDIFIHNNVEDAIKNADVIYLLRVQLERMKNGYFPSLNEYAKMYGLNKERIKLAKKDCIILHPGPMNKGIEISDDIAYDEKSMIQKQVHNGLLIRMALLLLTLKGEIL